MTPSEESSAPPVKRPTGFSVVINGKDIFPPFANEYREQMVTICVFISNNHNGTNIMQRKLEAKVISKVLTDATENGVTKHHQSLTNGETKMSEVPSGDKSPKLRTNVLTNGDVPTAKTLTNGDVAQKKIKKKLDDTTAVMEEPVKV